MTRAGLSPSNDLPTVARQSLPDCLVGHALAQAFAGGLLAASGLGRVEGALSPGTAGIGFGLGVIPGTFVGVLCGTLACLCVVAPRIATWIAVAVGLAVGLAMTEVTAVAAVLFTRGTPLSLLAAVALLVAAIAVALSVAWLTPRPGSPRAPLLRSGRLPALLGLLFLFALLGLVTEARVPEYYRLLRNAASLLCSAVLGLAVKVATAGLLNSLASKVGVGVMVWASPLLPLLLLTEHDQTARRQLDQSPLTRSGLDLARTLTDTDGDGASRFLGDGDCAPNDPAVSPRGRELPGNGLDDDCVFGDAPPDVPASPLPRAAEPSPVSVVLITVDAVRADRTSLSQPNLDTTPALADWAKGGIIFSQAYATSTRTCSSVASLLRGVFPLQSPWVPIETTRAWRDLIARYPGRTPPAPWMCGVDAESAALPPTLAERLNRRGMRTVAITNDDNTLVLSREVFGAGFEEYFDTLPNGDTGVVHQAEAVLQRLGAGPERFFLWVHLYGAHQMDPSADPEVVAHYDERLRSADQSVKMLLAAVSQLPNPDSVLTVITSDHGESFYPTDRGHGSNLSEQELRVPLVVRGPGVVPAHVSHAVSTADIVPTVLSLTQTAGAGTLAGESLLGDLDEPRFLHADVWNDYLGYAYSAAMGQGRKVVYDHRLRTWSAYETGTTERHVGELRAAAIEGDPVARELHMYLEKNHAHLPQ